MTQTALVSLRGDCLVSNINDHYRIIRQAFQSEGLVMLDLANVGAADITLIQLIVSASKTAAREHRGFVLRSVPDSLQDAICSAGISLNSESGQISC